MPVSLGWETESSFLPDLCTYLLKPRKALYVFPENGEAVAPRPSFLKVLWFPQGVLHRHALYLIIRMVCYDDGLGAGKSLLALKTTDASNEEYSLWVYQCNSLVRDLGLFLLNRWNGETVIFHGFQRLRKGFPQGPSSERINPGPAAIQTGYEMLLLGNTDLAGLGLGSPYSPVAFS